MPPAEAFDILAPYAPLLTDTLEATAEVLDRFRLLLERWQPAQNLVSRETLPLFWSRHIADSLQLLPLVGPGDRNLLDVGSGGGLPAIPLATALRRTHVLVEPNARKASFLRTVIRELDLKAAVVVERIERHDSRETPDVITARAVAPLPMLLTSVGRHFGANTRALLHKGHQFRDELQEARAQWAFDVVEHPSLTDPRAAVLEISNLRSRSAA